MSVPDVQDDLVALLRTTFASPVLVRFGRPPQLPENFDTVYVIDETGYRLGGGEQYRVESFEARVVVEVFRTGDDAKGTSDRRWQLVRQVDGTLMADDFHGYATEGSVLTAASSLDGYDNGWHALSTLTIAIGDEV